MAKTRMGGTAPREGRTFPVTKPRPSEVQIIQLGSLFCFTVPAPTDVIPALLNVADGYIDGDNWFAVLIENNPDISKEEYEQVIMASLYAIWRELINHGVVHGGVLPSITPGDPRDMIKDPEAIP